MPETWGVEVNETWITLHGGASFNWWLIYRYRILEPSGNTPTPVESGPFGDLVFIPRKDRKDATWLRDLAIGKGAPHGAVTVRKRALDGEPGEVDGP